MSAFDPKRTSSRRSYVPWIKSVELFGTRGLVKVRDTMLQCIVLSLGEGNASCRERSLHKL